MGGAPVTTQRIGALVDSHREEITQLATRIWENPEMGWKEEKAVAWTAEVLRANGFETEVGAYGMPTAIRAAWGGGGPVVGFCGEYDCLPGLSQRVCPTEDPIVPGGNGHGCGHNLLGAGCVAACVALKEALEESGQPGTVIFYGCPAEEQLSGKGFMARAGAFVECDFTLAWHPAANSHDTLGEHTGIEGGIFTFHGKTAHAGAAPHLGRSALDAAQLMNIGVEFLREHVTDDVRMHYQITDGGQAANIVPGRAQVIYDVRALSREATLDAYARVKRCAEGAAYMTETQLEITSTGGLYPTLQNHVIGQAVQEARALIPLEEYTPEELAFADEMNRTSPDYVEGETVPIAYEDQTLQHTHIFGSTDYGDVAHIRPGFQVREVTAPSLSRGHSWMMTASAGSSIGMKGMLRAAKIMAAAAYHLMTDPEKLAAMREEFDRAVRGREYQCPISDQVPWPYESDRKERP